MVGERPELDRVYHALAHPARREMLRRLAGGERNLSELAAPLKMTFPAASKHVRVLEAAHLVRRHVIGRDHVCRLEVGPLDRAAQWAEECRRLWEANFARLDALLEDLKAEEIGTGVQPGVVGPATKAGEGRGRRGRAHRRSAGKGRS